MKSYPLQRDLFLSLATALVAVHEIKVKTGRFHPLTPFGFGQEKTHLYH